MSDNDRTTQAEQLIARMQAARGYIYPEWELAARTDPDFTEAYNRIYELALGEGRHVSAKVREFVAIAGDRIPVSANPRVAWAQFFGAPAPFPVGPYVMASLLQCPVYLIFTFRRGRASEIHFELFRESVHLPRTERERALATLAADYAARLEHYCRQAPLQWFNFYQFWRLPAGDSSDASE